MGLKILAFVLIGLGAVIVYGATFLVKRFDLSRNIDVKEAEELTGENLEKYRNTKTAVRVKIVGFFVLLAGTLLLFYILR